VWQSFETVYRVINIKGSGRIKFVLGAKLMICVDKRPQLMKEKRYSSLSHLIEMERLQGKGNRSVHTRGEK
jgi:hypothetical protein